MCVVMTHQCRSMKKKSGTIKQMLICSCHTLCDCNPFRDARELSANFLLVFVNSSLHI